MLRKKETLTTITPIPGFIPRQLALDILHAHSEVITLNPLVLNHKPIPAPRNAAADEYYSTWYEINQRIQYLPGMGKAGSGKISFNGCFHDMPWGLQTHIYAPLNLDMRNTYRVKGNQPGLEPPEPAELGLEELGAPKDGLYLRHDIEFKCNIAMVSFVKSETKKATKEMIDRMIKKAELLDAGVLKAMFEDGKLKTLNPQDRSNTMSVYGAPGGGGGGGSSPGMTMSSPSQSPVPMYQSPMSPAQGQFARPPSGNYQTGGQYPHSPYQQHFQQQQQQTPTPPPGQGNAPPIPPKTEFAAMELPGDAYYSHPSRSPNGYQQQFQQPQQFQPQQQYQQQPQQQQQQQQQGAYYNPAAMQGGQHMSMGQVAQQPGFTAELDAAPAPPK